MALTEVLLRDADSALEVVRKVVLFMGFQKDPFSVTHGLSNFLSIIFKHNLNLKSDQVFHLPQKKVLKVFAY